MKIDNVNPFLRSTPTSSRDEAPKTGKPSEVESSTASTTRLSQLSSDDSHDIDTARVQEIRDAIREGRLEIRAERIADGLIKSLKE